MVITLKSVKKHYQQHQKGTAKVIHTVKLRELYLLNKVISSPKITQINLNPEKLHMAVFNIDPDKVVQERLY